MSYTISEGEFNLLTDAQRHAGLAATLARAHADPELWIEMRAGDLQTVFSFLEDCLREVIEAAEVRYRAKRDAKHAT